VIVDMFSARYLKSFYLNYRSGLSEAEEAIVEGKRGCDIIAEGMTEFMDTCGMRM